jgi:hypothetical protein
MGARCKVQGAGRVWGNIIVHSELLILHVPYIIMIETAMTPKGSNVDNPGLKHGE